MVVYHIHHDLDARFVKRVDHHLQLRDPRFVVRVGGVPAIRRIKMHRHVAPAVLLAVLVVVKVLPRQNLHDGGSHLDDVVEPRGQGAIRCHVRVLFIRDQLGVALRQPQKLALATDARVMVDRSVADVQLVNDALVRRNLGTVRDIRLVVPKNQPAARVARIAGRVRIDDLDPRKQALVGALREKLVVPAPQILMDVGLPTALWYRLHRNNGATVVSLRIVVENHADLRRVRRKAAEQAAVRAVNPAQLAVVVVLVDVIMRRPR
mmetsp:Transcript_6681/g.16215  ORF Transcript_6681/g.16215 Transcript_6681/m.16215 type:complete len:264 (+) Transcript_6681:1501-2292(+)